MNILKTNVFDTWLKKLKDKRAKAIIQTHIDRLIENKLGKTRYVGNSIHEKKINYGPAYRLYFMQYKSMTILLLCGGDKSTQQSDIQKAMQLAREIENN